MKTMRPKGGTSIEKESKIVAAMIGLYCRKKHGTQNGSLCEQCRDLLQYADARLTHCPYKPDKPPCRECATHCYRPEYRDRIKEVMRFSGPRILLYHPIEWLKHKWGR
jgi:hypothetical protein